MGTFPHPSGFVGCMENRHWYGGCYNLISLPPLTSLLCTHRYVTNPLEKMDSRRLAQTAPASSAISRPRTGGKVFVEKANVLEDIIAESEASSHGRRRYIKTQVIMEPSNEHSPGHHLSSKVDSPVIDMKHSKPTSNPHLEAVAMQREKRDKKFPHILAAVDRATSFLDEVDKEMNLAEEARRNKIRRQFEDWNTNVHGEIQKRIQTAVGEMDQKQLNKKKNEDYKKFLNVTNRKPAIFRDIIIESEYDPLEPNRRCYKAKTAMLEDPVKISEIKARKEASMLGTSTKGALPQKPALGKDTLDVKLWASGQIEATPYGTFAKMMSSSKGGSSSPHEKRSKTMQSHIHFDHFAFPKGRSAIDEEMPKGKRIYPEIIYSDPARVFAGLSENDKKELAAMKLPENRRTIY